MMSFPQLPPQANSGYQQRTAQPPHALAPALAPSPQSTVFVRVQSFPTIGQCVGGQSDLCQHFVEVCTSTYKWISISAADVQRLGALNIPVQVVSNGVPSGIPPSTGNGSKQSVQSGISQPTHAPVDGMKTTFSRGPTFFNAGHQVHTSQPQAKEMGPASYTGVQYEGRQISEHNGAR